MSSLNRVVLIGNLTRDPELRYTPSGAAMTKFGLAINRKYKAGDDWKEEVCFVDIVVWGKQAESSSEYLSKGRSVCVEGRLSYSSWETEDGQKRSKLEVVGERVVFLGGGRSGGSDGEKRSSYNSPSPGSAPPEDDVPF